MISQAQQKAWMVDGFPYTWGDRGEWVASRERKWQNVPLPELEAIKSLACYDDNNYSRHKATTLCVTGNERHGIFSEQHQREKKVTCPFTSSACSWFVCPWGSLESDMCAKILLPCMTTSGPMSFCESFVLFWKHKEVLFLCTVKKMSETGKIFDKELLDSFP